MHNIAGLEEIMAIVSVHCQVHNINPCDILGDKDCLPFVKGYSPTEVGEMMNPIISGRKINSLLESLGYQEKKDGEWVPTELGLEYSCIKTNIIKIIKDNIYTVKSTLRWKENIIDILVSRVHNC